MKMKTRALFGVLSLCFLFSTITAKPLFPITGKDDGESEAVRDIYGDEITTDSDYYILPVISGIQGGGLLMANISGCPLDVVQSPVELMFGQPLKLTHVTVTTGNVVRVSTNLKIKFNVPTPCNDSTTWKVNPYDVINRQYFISTGWVVGDTELSSWFRVIKYGLGYSFAYCPLGYDCKHVGCYIDGGYPRLALRDSPFVVVFIKPE